MTLRHEPDVSHADWFVHGGDAWTQLCSIGPSGFAAYARILHPTDEDIADEDDRLMNVEGDLEDISLSALTEVLGRHTQTPDDCFFALWEGFGDIHGGVVNLVRLGRSRVLRRRRRTRSRPEPAAFDEAVLGGPQVVIPQRSYFLFRGPLRAVGRWPSRNGARINSPNLIWPADRTWFVASEIDQPWTGVGGPVELIDELLAHDELDAVPAAASPDLPYARD